MTMLRRLGRNSAANNFGIFSSIVVQLATVPALIGAWGAHAFGVWTMMATIPAYLALSDLGFTDAACSEMTLRNARADRAGAAAVFQTTALLLAAIAGAVVLVGAAILLTLRQVDAAPDWLRANALVLLGLVLFSGLALFSRVPVMALRATGHYATGTFAYDSLVMAEGVALVGVALLGGGFGGAVAALIAGRLVNLATLYPIMRRHVPWLTYGRAHASRAEAHFLLPRALGALAIPGVAAVQIQFSVLVIGAVLSPLAVAVYVPVRTASRIAVLVVYGFSNATMPELSAAAAVEDRPRLVKLVLGNLLLIGGMLLPGAILFALLGPTILSLWTGGKLSAGILFTALMAAAMALHGAWNILSRMLLAINQHGRLAARLSLAAPLSLLLLALGAYAGGLAGAAAAGAVMEAIYLAFAIALARRHLVIRGHARTGLRAIRTAVLAKLP